MIQLFDETEFLRRQVAGAQRIVQAPRRRHAPLHRLIQSQLVRAHRADQQMRHDHGKQAPVERQETDLRPVLLVGDDGPRTKLVGHIGEQRPRRAAFGCRMHVHDPAAQCHSALDGQRKNPDQATPFAHAAPVKGMGGVEQRALEHHRLRPDVGNGQQILFTLPVRLLRQALRQRAKPIVAGLSNPLSIRFRRRECIDVERREQMLRGHRAVS